MDIRTIAVICHELNAAYCKAVGDDTQVPWDEAPEWQKSSAIEGVTYYLEHPEVKPSEMHEAWLNAKLRDGWVYGDTKSAKDKTHPCIVSYANLPASQRAKDYLFTQSVKTLAPLLG